MSKEKVNKTNACRILDQKKIAYELIPYEVDENGQVIHHQGDEYVMEPNNEHMD